MPFRGSNQDSPDPAGDSTQLNHVQIVGFHGVTERRGRSLPTRELEFDGVATKAQGVALKVGKGRVVIMGEAAMFSAQVFKFAFEGKPGRVWTASAAPRTLGRSNSYAVGIEFPIRRAGFASS